MIIAWQTVNAVRHPTSKQFTRGFLVCAPRLTIKDRLRVLQPNAEGTLFSWTVSDFSLMDAIECGIVKLPRVPVAENIPGNEMPMFRNLWENIRKDMPTKGRGKGEELDPLKLPTRFQTALQSLYGHYEKTFKMWEGKGIKVPPCFILVCQNTAISKLVYDFISGFHRRHGCYWRLEEILGKLRRPFYDVVR